MAATDPDDDFEKRWGVAPIAGKSKPAATPAPAAAAPKTAEDDFEKRWRAAPVPTPVVEAPKQALADVISSPVAVASDVPGVAAADVRQTPVAGEALKRIGSAAVEGYQETPPILTPAAQAALDAGGPLNRWITNPLFHAAGAIPAAFNGLMYGASQAATEASGDPRLGRDAMMLQQILPFSRIGAPRHPPLTPSVQAAPPTPRFVQEHFGERPPGDPLAAAPAQPVPSFMPPDAVTPAARPAEPPAFVPPNPLVATPEGVPLNAHPLAVGPDGQPLPPPPTAPEPPPPVAAAAESAAPRSVGAMGTPLDLTKMDIAEEKAARTTGEISELMQTPQPGDATVYVEGVYPTKAEIEQNPSVSRESKMLRQEFREGYNEKEKADNERYHDAYDQHAGTATIVQSMERARDEKWGAKREEMLARKGSADVRPMLEYEQTVLDSEDGSRPLVRSALKGITDELTDRKTGELITDPRRLYGVRKHINDKIDEVDLAGKKVNTRVMSQLIAIRDVLDGVMEPAVGGGWKEYLKGYEQDSRPIDVMNLLQKNKFKLTNGSDRTMTFGKFDKFMKDIALERAQKGVSEAESMTEETRASLMGIWKSLARSASDQELAKARGSDTSQMLMELTRKGIIGGAHIAAGALTGGVGNIAIPMITKAFDERHHRNMLQRHLSPDLGKYPNALEAP